LKYVKSIGDKEPIANLSKKFMTAVQFDNFARERSVVKLLNLQKFSFLVLFSYLQNESIGCQGPGPSQQ